MNGLDAFFALPTAVKVFIACLALVQLTLAVVALVTLVRMPDYLVPPIGRTRSLDTGMPRGQSRRNGEADARVDAAETPPDTASQDNPSRRTRLLWAVIIILGELVGPIIFFIMRSRHARLAAELANDATAKKGLGASSRHDTPRTTKVEAGVSALYDDGPTQYDDGSTATHTSQRHVNETL
ncbi:MULTISPECIES: hypothetical protein [unclassified Actinobaculum]|uniref:hypothetical protein n=1 Tax=unclassified Actinobaculum TaxID=2609299 RepID=UPI000D5291FC|nr:MULTISPECIES: hypothetical protein [unclassified Actinobaculum]AWE41917.1 hypothetical protein DDD63_03145 [Actinobaculum sp. 313]RTE50169.1 hypothetical protein EKN07_02820 [Actinobaculum sp. 352]